METTWVCAWFQRLLQHVQSFGKDEHKIIIADRSPLSAVYYSRTNGQLLEPVIRTMVDEVREAADLYVLTAHIRADPARLWSRIQERLLREPHRLALNENSREWAERTLAFYDRTSWDVTVANNDVSLNQLMGNVLRSLMPVSPALKAAVAALHGTVESLVAAAESGSPKAVPAASPSSSSSSSVSSPASPSTAMSTPSTTPSKDVPSYASSPSDPHSAVTPAKSRGRMDSDGSILDPCSPSLSIPQPGGVTQRSASTGSAGAASPYSMSHMVSSIASMED
jgi:hypothetical protein